MAGGVPTIFTSAVWRIEQVDTDVVLAIEREGQKKQTSPERALFKPPDTKDSPGLDEADVAHDAKASHFKADWHGSRAR